MDTEMKLSLAVVIVLIITALVDLRISAALATAYLIGYAVNRMRKNRIRREAKEHS